MNTRVVVTDQSFGNTDQEEAVAARHGASFHSFQCRSEADAARAVVGADVVFVNLAPLTRAALSRMAPGSTVIRYGVGYDNVDIEAARELGIRVANVPDYGSDTVADHTVALLLSTLRKLPMYDLAIRRSAWTAPASLGRIRGFTETTVGLIGTGRIGLEVARRLLPFGFRVLAHDPYAAPGALEAAGIEAADLPDLLRRSHAVSLHCPLTEETRHIIDAKALALLPDNAVLVNTSRGGLVDERAVAEALADGSLAAAGLDVFPSEPLAEDSPLREQQSAVLTPHCAFYSEGSLSRLQRLAAEEADRALSGQPLRSAV